MKKLLLTAFAVTCAASVFAQGTIAFNTRLTGTIVSHVYYNSAISAQIVGNGTADTPVGAHDWTGYTLLTGSGYSAALLGANGAGVAESSLTFGATPTVTSFRTGTAAGCVAVTTATLNQVPADAAVATLELFAWDNKGGTLTDPVAALAAWRAGTAIGGLSGAFNVNSIGGSVNTPPALVGLLSFNIYAVPEPSTMALAGLAAASLLIFRRRK